MDSTSSQVAPERQVLESDIVCVGFGPATAGFLTTLSRSILDADGTPALESLTAPGLPLQVNCYERADDIGFGVSGVATKARALRASFPGLDPSQISMAARIRQEKLVYLLDPLGASRRTRPLRLADSVIRALKWLPIFKQEALELPYIPPFLRKEGGLVLSIGQFNQWVGSLLMESGTVVIWPGTPVSEALIEGGTVTGVRLADQGIDKRGVAGEGYMPGMDIRAALTVVGDGPIGPVGRQLDEAFGLPRGNHQREWAVGMKMVVDLRESVDLEPGTVLHTFGYPEPEIFGFFYVHAPQVASVGIFVPSWFQNPVRTSYRYLQHFMMHPYLWRYLEGGTLRSWGAKSLFESGRRGEPYLVGDGYARIGEGSGSTNVLTGSGVDEAWATGCQLAEGVIDLLRSRRPFTKENLQETYLSKRRASWVEQEARIAEKARNGFQKGLIRGLVGMALAGITGGRLTFSGNSPVPADQIPSLEDYYQGKLSRQEIEGIREECRKGGSPLHDALMERVGWPPVPLDGKLLVSQQDALLIGGKVQAPPGYADHVVFLYPSLCESCGTQICVEICSGEAISANPEGGVPLFDREKCVHCGACIWNCSESLEEDSERGNIRFRAGAGGLHSAEN